MTLNLASQRPSWPDADKLVVLAATCEQQKQTRQRNKYSCGWLRSALAAVKKLASVRCNTVHICCRPTQQYISVCLTHVQRHALRWHCQDPQVLPPRRPLGRIGSIPAPTSLNNRIGVLQYIAAARVICCQSDRWSPIP